MEFLATFGLAAKELFDYNRENYQFDAEQRLTRELLRLEMQVARFELFREDIRDLVELTVGKMEMYHLVGALFLEKTVALYCEGRIKTESPPYLISAYYLAVAGGFACLVLAVWLSMYASICSHSFGVRLLTRFVRLPIPGEDQLNSLNAKLSDFEAQGATAMRVPFTRARQDWKRNYGQQGEGASGSDPQASGSGGASSSTAKRVIGQEDLLGQGEIPVGALNRLMKETKMLPGKHVQLYRRLQNKWQCYDAYTRVCMSIGANQILLAFTFYLMNVTLIQYSAPSACYASIIAFQYTALSLFYIDIARVGHLTMLAWQALPLIATFMAAIDVNVADKVHDERIPEADHRYRCLPISFFLIAAWFEVMLHIAAPSRDDASLPRRFRAVLFLDVFDDAGLKVQAAEGQLPTEWNLKQLFRKAPPKKPLLTAKIAQQADDSLFAVHAALRRWESIPSGVSEAQLQYIRHLRRELNIWRETLNDEAAERARNRGIQDAYLLLEMDNRPWNDLSDEEQAQDPWAGYYCGPMKTPGAPEYYYHPESKQFVYRLPEGAPVITSEYLKGLLSTAEGQVRTVLDNPEHKDQEASQEAARQAAGSSSDESTSGEETEVPKATRAFSRGFSGIAGGFVPLRNRGEVGHTPYVAPRRPWTILRLYLRAVQAAWVIVGVFAVLDGYFGIKVDYQNYIKEEEEKEVVAGGEHVPLEEAAAEGASEEHSEAAEEEAGGAEEGGAERGEERRLGSGRRSSKPYSSLLLRRHFPKLPHGDLFRAKGLSCLPPGIWSGFGDTSDATSNVGGSAFSTPSNPSGSSKVSSNNSTSNKNSSNSHSNSSSSGSSISGTVLVSTAFDSVAATYRDSEDDRQWHFESIPSFVIAPEERTICGPSHCLLASLSKNGTALALRALDVTQAGRVELPLVIQRPWRRFAGSLVECSKVSAYLDPGELQNSDNNDDNGDNGNGDNDDNNNGNDDNGDVSSDSGDNAGLCLLLAGYDGDRIVVAASALLFGQDLVAEGVLPSFDLSFSPPSALGLTSPSAPELADLLIDASSATLWALSSSSTLEAHTLLPPRRLGSWRLGFGTHGPASDFRAEAFCASSNDHKNSNSNTNNNKISNSNDDNNIDESPSPAALDASSLAAQIIGSSRATGASKWFEVSLPLSI